MNNDYELEDPSSGEKTEIPPAEAESEDFETIERQAFDALVDHGYSIQVVKTYPIHYRKHLEVYNVLKHDEASGITTKIFEEAVVVESPAPPNEDMSDDSHDEDDTPPPPRRTEEELRKDPINALLESSYKAKSGKRYLPTLVNPSLPGLDPSEESPPSSKKRGKKGLCRLASMLPSPFNPSSK